MFRIERVFHNKNDTVQFAVLVNGESQQVVVTKWTPEVHPETDVFDDKIERVLTLTYADHTEREATTANAASVARRLAQDPTLDPDALLQETVVDPVRAKAEAKQDQAIKRWSR